MDIEAQLSGAIKQCGNRYLLVNLLSQRIHQLKTKKEGNPPALKQGTSLLETALQDFVQKRLNYEVPQKEPPAPPPSKGRKGVARA